jgi:predicted ATPase
VLGYPDQAVKKIEQAIALAQEQSHSYSLAVALLNASGVYHACGNEPVAQRHAEAAIALSTEQGFANFLGQATAHLGAALAQQGKEEKGIALIREGIATCRATGALLFQPLFIGHLAEAYEVAKRFEEGLVALAEAFAIVGRTGERYYEAELYRLKGELTLKQSITHHLRFSPRQVEECFWKAVEIAREQQAKSSELRAVMSLSRLLQRQGKNAAARQMLEEIRDWFSEGFDTQDLKAAAALLKELS